MDLDKTINEVIEENPTEIEKYRSGEGKYIGFLMGKLMVKLRGYRNDHKELYRKLKLKIFDEEVSI